MPKTHTLSPEYSWGLFTKPARDVLTAGQTARLKLDTGQSPAAATLPPSISSPRLWPGLQGLNDLALSLKGLALPCPWEFQPPAAARPCQVSGPQGRNSTALFPASDQQWAEDISLLGLGLPLCKTGIIGVPASWVGVRFDGLGWIPPRTTLLRRRYFLYHPSTEVRVSHSSFGACHTPGWHHSWQPWFILETERSLSR